MHAKTADSLPCVGSLPLGNLKLGFDIHPSFDILAVVANSWLEPNDSRLNQVKKQCFTLGPFFLTLLYVCITFCHKFLHLSINQWDVTNQIYQINHYQLYPFLQCRRCIFCSWSGIYMYLHRLLNAEVAWMHLHCYYNYINNVSKYNSEYWTWSNGSSNRQHHNECVDSKSVVWIYILWVTYSNSIMLSCTLLKTNYDISYRTPLVMIL